MRVRHPEGSRNAIDMSDRVQVRIIRRRLKVSEEQLAMLVQKAGPSIAAVRKEASLTLSLPRGGWEPPPEVVAAGSELDGEARQSVNPS